MPRQHAVQRHGLFRQSLHVRRRRRRGIVEIEREHGFDVRGRARGHDLDELVVDAGLVFLVETFRLVEIGENVGLAGG